MKLFSLFTGVKEDDAREHHGAQGIRDLVSDYQITIARLEGELAEIEARLAHPGHYLTRDEHGVDVVDADVLRREVAAFKDRILDLDREAVEQETRERRATLEARRGEQKDFTKRHKALTRDYEAAVAKLREIVESLIALETAYEVLNGDLAAEGLEPMKTLTELFAEPQKVIRPEELVYKDVWYEPLYHDGPLVQSSNFVAGRPVHRLAELKREFSHRIPEELSPGRRYIGFAERRRAVFRAEVGL